MSENILLPLCSDYRETKRTNAQDYLALLQDSRYLQRVERIARCNTRGTTIPWEDAAQTAHEKIILALRDNKFHPEKGSFYHWSAKISKFAIIDLVRREQRKRHLSLDQKLAGTKFSWLDNIPSKGNLWATLEREDLLICLVEAIAQLDEYHPQRQYFQLWQGRMRGENQTQLAVALGTSQGTISKRWQELVSHINCEVKVLLQQTA
ncbi:MAG: sigma-70 family RNA polymerase sigma factor [Spirulinaceae cyanobacterium]